MKEQSDKKIGWLSLAALGVVYGDIGTSPLYAMRESFNPGHGALVTRGHIFGVLSLIFWSLLLVISLKYLVLIMRADNQGEGGILSLMQLVLPKKNGSESKPDRSSIKSKLILFLGLFGAALLYGDGVLTPAISVLSAIEGVEIAAPSMGNYILPLTILILFLLFWLQSRGTSGVGKLFGPIMLLWFVVLAILGLLQIFQAPEILRALNPLYAIRFMAHAGITGLFVLGAVFLAVTGGEALYADIGHFGLPPIRIAWFSVVLPGLLLNYFGQGALLLSHPNMIQNPFYYLAPEWAHIPLMILATLATIIASQAVISGAFSLTFQAIQLNYLPRFRVLHTSETEAGQVYLPKVNKMLLMATVLVVLMSRSSSNIAVAYGIAIALTMVITDILAFFAMRSIWKWSLIAAIPVSLFFLLLDLSFLSANSLKFLQGGWFAILIAALIYFCYRVWIRGQRLVAKKLAEHREPLSEYVNNFDRSQYKEVDGVAVYMTSQLLKTPVTLIHNLEHNKVVHKKIIFLGIAIKNDPFVSHKDRLLVEDLGNGFYRVLVKYGYYQRIEMKNILNLWKDDDALRDYVKGLTFFVNENTIYVKEKSPLRRLASSVYVFLRKNGLSATRYFHLPEKQVFQIGMQLEI